MIGCLARKTRCQLLLRQPVAASSRECREAPHREPFAAGRHRGMTSLPAVGGVGPIAHRIRPIGAAGPRRTAPRGRSPPIRLTPGPRWGSFVQSVAKRGATRMGSATRDAAGHGTFGRSTAWVARLFGGSPMALFGGLALTALVLLAVFAPAIAPYDPLAQIAPPLRRSRPRIRSAPTSSAATCSRASSTRSG